MNMTGIIVPFAMLVIVGLVVVIAEFNRWTL